MKNTYILTIEYDEEKAKRNPYLSNILNISDERFQSLMAAAIYDRKHECEKGRKQFDGFASFLRLLEEEKFNGNEVLLYAVTGYLSALRCMPPSSNAAEAMIDAGVEDITV